MAVSAAVLARLTALRDEGAQPYHKGKGLAMWVGGMRLRAADGKCTEPGRAWESIGGSEPVRFRGEMQRTYKTKCIDVGGTKHILWKLARTPRGPERQPMRKGLRFGEQNEWEAMRPAIGHTKDRHGNFHTFQDRVVITDDMVTRNVHAFETSSRLLPTFRT